MLSPNGGRSGATPGAAGRQPERQPQAWLHARARLMPQLLIQAPPWIRGVFDHAWAPMEALTQQVSCLPPALWDHLLDCAGGFVLVCTGDSRYVPGPGSVRHQRVHNVAYVSVEDLAMDNERPLHVLGHLIDHHLGGAGEVDALWLSGKGVVTPGWREAGARLARLYDLGYGVDEAARSDIRDYFAQSLAFYCRDRQRLNVADPQIYKWFRSTLWNEAFWQGQRY
jgi:hypothetical protein